MSDLQFRVENKIAYLWINRPQAMNALHRGIIDELDCLLDQLAEDKKIRALIIGNEGNFAAGADIKEMVECSPEEAYAFAFSPTYNKLMDLPIPTIAAIDGYALGGGLELALACDIRIASEDAQMGLPELGIGIMPGAGGTVRLPQLIGYAKAFEIIALGKFVSGVEAERIGLVNKTVAKENLINEAQTWANKLAQKAPVAMVSLKRTMLHAKQMPSIKEAIVYEADEWAALFATADQKEGMRAFIEKRKPQFLGE